MSLTKEIFYYDVSLNEPLLCGCDEVGRGPLAGSVVCAAVIMPLDVFIDGIYDSKKLTEKQRNILSEKIKQAAIAYSICEIDNTVIDQINILNATKLCLKNAVESLKIKPRLVLVDALTLDISLPQKNIIKGDATSYNIAAASILAKVHRDEQMRQYHVQYPQYGFDKHKGYGTAVHIAAVKQCGLCEIHRKSFCKNFF